MTETMLKKCILSCKNGNTTLLKVALDNNDISKEDTIKLIKTCSMYNQYKALQTIVDHPKTNLDDLKKNNVESILYIIDVIGVKVIEKVKTNEDKADFINTEKNIKQYLQMRFDLDDETITDAYKYEEELM